MDEPNYIEEQREIIDLPYTGRVFLDGPAGCGKTTAGTARLYRMIESGIPADTILILAPQRTLAFPYYRMLSRPELPAGSLAEIFTLGGLAQRTVQLFWPLVAAGAGFSRPDLPPVFLNVETAQYYMARVVAPLREQGYFDSVTIEANRLYSQILSNLNSAAAVGFPYLEIGDRLKDAWQGKPAQLHVYDEAQDCAIRFRKYCLEHNLLDFSLAVEIFHQRLWPSPHCRNYLANRYHHLIYDNIEEDFAVAHDIIREWLPDFQSALLVNDTQAGYRSFLAADPESAITLCRSCEKISRFERSLVTPTALQSFAQVLEQTICQQPVIEIPPKMRQVLTVTNHQYFPDMIETVSQEIARLVQVENIPPGEIAVMSPFLSGSLRFSLMNRLEQQGIPVRSHRPSRSLRDEPATQCLLTLAKLAHPAWEMSPSRHDLRYALMQVISGLDLMRADLLAQIVYSPNRADGTLGSFDRIRSQMQERITYQVGGHYETLRGWLEAYRTGSGDDLDIFLKRLFGEVLSQPGFGFHDRYDAAAVAAQLIESVQHFRWNTSEAALEPPDLPAGKEYIRMVEDGVIGAQYLPGWIDQPEDAVFLAPAFTFLVRNRPVRIQFWLDIGNNDWWERLDQPITHAHVLSRRWQRSEKWSDSHEVQVNRETLSRLAHGLIRRCSEHLYLCYAEFNEQGNQQRGELFMSLYEILRQLPENAEA